MAFYAWSPIRGGTHDKPVNIARGEKVTQSDLGAGDADWNAYLESGAIREKEFPAPEDFDGSVIDYLREKLQEAQSLSAVDEEEAASELAVIQNAATASGELPEPVASEAPKPQASSTSAKK
jgi:hypothetical protein